MTTTDTRTIQERLRDRARAFSSSGVRSWAQELSEAADRIETLEKALKPFSDKGDVLTRQAALSRNIVPTENFPISFTYGQCLNARAALHPSENEVK